MSAIPFDFMDQTLTTMQATPRHTYLILSKRPERMRVYFCDHIPQTDLIWPLDNVWLGVTAESQEQADKRVPILLSIPAAHRFVSIEPMLGPVDIAITTYWDDPSAGIHAVILGGETGPHARPMQPEWAINIVRQCKSAAVPMFVKHIHVNGKVSKDMNEWPEELRTRQLPWLNHGSPLNDPDWLEREINFSLTRR